MNRKFTLIVAGLALALVALAISQRDQVPVDLAQGTATPTPGPIFSFGEGDLQEVTVSGSGGQSYTLSRVAGGWQVDGAQASDWVSSTVRNIATLSAAQRLTGRQAVDYGFDSPVLTVTLKTAAGAETSFQVGDETPVDTGYRYLRLIPDDGLILVVTSWDLQQLLDWLDNPPLAPTPTPEVSPTPEDEGDVGEETGEPTEEGTAEPGEPDEDATAEAGETPTAVATPSATPTTTALPTPSPTS